MLLHWTPRSEMMWFLERAVPLPVANSRWGSRKNGEDPSVVKLRGTMTEGSVRGESKVDELVKMVFLAPIRAILSER
jgi:hypothetical protein